MHGLKASLIRSLAGGETIPSFFSFFVSKTSKTAIYPPLFMLIFLFILVFITHNASAGGSGDYPPPASGNWDINVPTSVDNETITLQGSININADFTLDNCSVRFLQTADDQYHISTVLTPDVSIFFMNSEFYDVGGKQLAYLTISCHHIIFYNSSFQNIKAGTLRMASMDIQKCTFSSFQEGVDIMDFAPCIVENNTFEDGEGVYFHPSIPHQVISYAMSVQNNRILNATTYGIKISNYDAYNESIAFSQNSISPGGQAYGLYLISCTEFKFTNCSFSGVESIYANLSSDINFSYCTLNENGGGDGEIKLNEAFNIVLWNSYHSHRVVDSISTYQVWWHSTMRIMDFDFYPLSGAYMELEDRFENIWWGYTVPSSGIIDGYILEEENRTNMNDFLIEVSFNGKTAYRDYQIRWEDNVTFVFDEFKIYKVKFYISFYNSFTGLGEDSQLLRIYYFTEVNPVWKRVSDFFEIPYIRGLNVSIIVQDYFYYTVDEQQITLSYNDTYFIDFGVPLAIIHLDNPWIDEFSISRIENGESMQIKGSEVKLIASFKGNSSILYHVSWSNTTKKLLNGTTVHIEGGEYTFSAEASAGNVHVVPNISSVIRPTFEKSVPPEEGVPWYASNEVKMYAAISGLLGVPLTIFAYYRFSKRVAKEVNKK